MSAQPGACLRSVEVGRFSKSKKNLGFMSLEEDYSGSDLYGHGCSDWTGGNLVGSRAQHFEFQSYFSNLPWSLNPLDFLNSN